MNPLFLVHVGVFAVAALACLGSAWRAREVAVPTVRHGLVALTLASAAWAGANLGYLLVPSAPGKRAMTTVGLLFGVVAVVAWLSFAAAYTGRDPAALPYRRLAIGGLVGLLALKATNPWHGLYFTAEMRADPFVHLAISHGIVHWLAMGLAYALATVGVFMLLEHFDHAGADTRPLAALVGATTLPIGADILGLVSPRVLPMTYEPVGVAIFAVGASFVYRERFRTVHLAGENDEPVIFVDETELIRDYNSRASTLFPALTDAIGDPLADVVPKLAADPEQVSLDCDGETRYFRVTRTPFMVGEIETGRSIVLTDTTDRQHRQAQLRLYERAVEGAGELIAAVDTDRRYLLANRAYREFYDLAADEVRETTLTECLGDDVVGQIDPYVERALAGEAVQHRTTRHRPGRASRTFDARYYPLENEAGEVEGVIATLRDLTPQLEREHHLASLSRLLRHNLRNELNVILGRADLLAESESAQGVSTAAITDAADRILRQAKKERDIVELLAEPTALKQLDLRAVVDRVVDPLAAAHPEATITVDVPAIEVTTAPEIERAIEELLENALVHAGEAPTVAVRAREQPTEVTIAVADDGPGVPSAERAVIVEDAEIEPLVHSRGMGLWLVKRIATRANGTIEITDRDGGGTVVTLRLPHRPDDREA